MWYQQSPAEGDTTHTYNTVCIRGWQVCFLISAPFLSKSEIKIWHLHELYSLFCLTCWALLRDRSSIKGRTVSGDGPNLAGSPDGDGLERLVSSHVEPRGSLRHRMLEQLPPKYLFLLQLHWKYLYIANVCCQELDIQDVLLHSCIKAKKDNSLH